MPPPRSPSAFEGAASAQAREMGPAPAWATASARRIGGIARERLTLEEQTTRARCDDCGAMFRGRRKELLTLPRVFREKGWRGGWKWPEELLEADVTC